MGNNNSGGSISNSYTATSSVSGGSGSSVGGLVGYNVGGITGTNHFVASAGGTDGVHTGSCDTGATCSRAAGADDDARRTGLQDTLNESAATGMAWSTDHWRNFGGGTGDTGIGYPLLKYAQVSYCSDSSHATEAACLAPGTCDIEPATNTDRDACEGATPTAGEWTSTNSWDAGDDECDGNTGVACGDTIINCSDNSYTGIGSAASPYLICNYAQLDKMRNDLAAHYQLVRHIDASESYEDGTKRSSTADTDCTPYDPTLAEDAPTTTDGHPAKSTTCTGWTPLGTTVGSTTTTAFTGSLQGAGYEIRNLYINISTTIAITRVGLFGQTGSASVIQNLGVTNAYIQVDVQLLPVLACWWGRMTGSISNSYATGSLTSQRFQLPMLAGWWGGIIVEVLSNSYATGSVTGSNSNFRVGGLVGVNGNGGSISNSYVYWLGHQQGYRLLYAGGLVGLNARRWKRQQ